jgi:hypothetical protein
MTVLAENFRWVRFSGSVTLHPETGFIDPRDPQG